MLLSTDIMPPKGIARGGCGCLDVSVDVTASSLPRSGHAIINPAIDDGVTVLSQN